jgi:hypothetical protein
VMEYMFYYSNTQERLFVLMTRVSPKTLCP